MPMSGKYTQVTSIIRVGIKERTNKKKVGDNSERTLCTLTISPNALVISKAPVNMIRRGLFSMEAICKEFLFCKTKLVVSPLVVKAFLSFSSTALFIFGENNSINVVFSLVFRQLE